jgi:hypothetical protein
MGQACDPGAWEGLFFTAVSQCIRIQELGTWATGHVPEGGVGITGSAEPTVYGLVFVAVLEFKLRVSCLLGRCSTVLFCISYFSGRVSHFCQGLASALNPSTYAYGTASVTGAYHHAWLVGWDGVLITFPLGWPRASILLISASRVAEIIAVSYHARPVWFVYCLSLRVQSHLWEYGFFATLSHIPQIMLAQ